jgi:hypothetical protein
VVSPTYRGSSALIAEQAHSSNIISAVEQAVRTLKLDREARSEVSGVERTTPDVPDIQLHYSEEDALHRRHQSAAVRIYDRMVRRL